MKEAFLDLVRDTQESNLLVALGIIFGFVWLRKCYDICTKMPYFYKFATQKTCSIERCQQSVHILPLVDDELWEDVVWSCCLAYF